MVNQQLCTYSNKECISWFLPHISHQRVSRAGFSGQPIEWRCLNKVSLGRQWGWTKWKRCWFDGHPVDESTSTYHCPSANWFRVKRTEESYWFNWLWLPLSVSCVCCRAPSTHCLCPDQFNQLLLRGYAEPQSRLNVPLEGTSLTAGLSVAVASKPKYTIVWFVIPFSVIRGGWWAARTPSLLRCVSPGCLVCSFELICFNCCSPFPAANVAKLRFHSFVCPLGLCY